MVTMIDQLYDRHYREARTELNASAARGLSRLGKAINDAFEVLVGSVGGQAAQRPLQLSRKRRAD